MAYVKHNWIDDTSPALSAKNLNEMETGIEEAANRYIRSYDSSVNIIEADTPYTMIGPSVDEARVLVSVELSLIYGSPLVGGLDMTGPIFDVIDGGFFSTDGGMIVGVTRGTSNGRHALTVSILNAGTAFVSVNWLYRNSYT